MQWDEFATNMKELGFLGPFICSCADYTTSNDELLKLIGIKSSHDRY